MSEKIYSVEAYAKTAREAIAEGCVLLKNEGAVLPLQAGSKIALFGRSQTCYFKSGTGSGGMVNTSYVTGIKEALERDSRFELNQELLLQYEEWLKDHPFDVGAGWAQEPWFQEEMPITEEIAKKAATQSDVAIVIIGRTAGEDKDNKVEPGSYLLTGEEEALLDAVCHAFEQTIVLLNVGNIIDMAWMDKYQPKAVMYVWQGGQEGGNGVVDLLSGDVSPSGKLSDTIAYDIKDYPSTENFGDEKQNIYAEDIYVGYRYFSTFAPQKVRYPFGYGLSYTTFATTATIEADCSGELPSVTVKAEVTNTGAVAGKEAVLVYVQAPQGRLGKATRVLCGYGKTNTLLPGESQTISLEVPAKYFVSYDDSGATGHKSCYVLEAGEYVFYVGDNVRDAVLAGSFSLESLLVAEELEEAMAPAVAFDRLTTGAPREDGTFEAAKQSTPLRSVDMWERRKERMPKCMAYTKDRGYRLSDVEEGKVSMDEFLAQFSDEELCCLVRGEGMCSPKVTAGTAAAFGGVTKRLQEFGLPVACCADGPSGIRMDCGTIAFAMPNGTCLACTFNDTLVGDLYEWEGMELRKNNIDTLLGPGINIHRNPLNGRNFEYFSEDPFLTGKMAVAQLRAMHKYGVTGTIKHFACNNQEFSRHFAMGIVSERALREIYLKGYEIAVKEGDARSIMSTYGPVNGMWTAGNYDLLTTILRMEWGYTGIVMTDWWAKINVEGEEATIQNTAAMVRAQNDLYMVTGDSLGNTNQDNSEEELQKGTVQRAEFVRCGTNICNFLLQSYAYIRLMGRTTALDEELQRIAEEESVASGTVYNIELTEKEISIDPSCINTEKGRTTVFQVTVKDRGLYQMELTYRASSDCTDLAQIPLSIFQDMQLADMISLAGSEKEWKTSIIKFPNFLMSYTFYAKLFFGMGGMEIKECKIAMSQSYEEEIVQGRQKELSLS